MFTSQFVHDNCTFYRFIYLGIQITSDNISMEIRQVRMDNHYLYGLTKYIRFKVLIQVTKFKFYITLAAGLINGTETWALSQSDVKMLNTFERKLLRINYGHVNIDGE